MKWFDFDGDGNISPDEEFLAFKIFEEVTKEDDEANLFDEDEESYGIDDPDDFEDDLDFDGSFRPSEWDDEFEGIDDPDDYEDWS